MIAKTVIASLQTGVMADWYIHENRDECQRIWEEKHPYQDPIFASAFFAEVGDYNPMANFYSNSWEGGIVSGPYATEEEAQQAAENFIMERTY